MIVEVMVLSLIVLIVLDDVCGGVDGRLTPQTTTCSDDQELR